MTLTVKVGATVVARIDGHGATDGAVIVDGSTTALTSNDPTVATVPASTPVPAGGTQSFEIPVTILGKGATDIHQTTTTPDGTLYEDTASLVVEELQPGLLTVTITLLEKP